MKKIISSLILAASVLFTNHLFALDDSSTISSDAKKILSSLKKEFKLGKLSPATQKLITDQFSFALKGNWYSYWLGNEDLKSSRFKTSKIRVYDLIIVNDNRVNNISFTYFNRANQIFYVRKQYVAGSSDNVLELFKEHKAEEDTEIKRETDTFAFTQTKGYIDFDIFHIKSSSGLAAYIDAGVIDIE